MCIYVFMYVCIQVGDIVYLCSRCRRTSSFALRVSLSNLNALFGSSSKKKVQTLKVFRQSFVRFEPHFTSGNLFLRFSYLGISEGKNNVGLFVLNFGDKIGTETFKMIPEECIFLKLPDNSMTFQSVIFISTSHTHTHTHTHTR